MATVQRTLIYDQETNTIYTAFFPRSLHMVNENLNGKLGRAWEPGYTMQTFQLAWIISIDGLTILVHWVKHVINLGSISILPY